MVFFIFLKKKKKKRDVSLTHVCMYGPARQPSLLRHFDSADFSYAPFFSLLLLSTSTDSLVFPRCLYR